MPVAPFAFTPVFKVMLPLAPPTPESRDLISILPVSPPTLAPLTT